MSAASVPVSANLRRIALRHRAAWPAVALLVAATAAYWFTLSSLADYLRLDTPLAYLLMLPLFSLLVVVATVARYRNAPPPPREPHIDLIVGTPLLIVAVLMLALLPSVWSTYYWSERPDVISLALFVSGGVIVAYGTTWFWRMRSALLFIVLMWPAFYLHLMAGPMQWFTDGTNAVLTAAARMLPLGVTTGPNNILTLPTGGGKSIAVALSTACSGVNGVLGMLLVGSALAVVFDGPRRRKLLWLLAGVVLVFAFNIARLLSILALASGGHPDLALGSYHAVIGLVLFTAALLAMMLLAPRFGLRWDWLITSAASTATGTQQPPSRPRTLGRARIPAVAGIALVGVLAFTSERDLGAYASFIDGTGAPVVRAFSSTATVPIGWKVSYATTYPWAQQYFGSSSRFDRYLVDYGGNHRTEAWMDVVRTDDQGALEAYNIQSCFLFHNYQLHTSRRIDIGHGVVALLINYSDPQTKDRWVSVSWAWPVLYHDQTSYERITLTADLARDGAHRAPDPQPSTGVRGVVLNLINSFGAGSSRATDSMYGSADHALQGVATAMVDSTMRGASS